MLKGIRYISEITHPTRRGFLQMFGAAVLPKPPIDLGKNVDVAEASLGGISLEGMDSGIFSEVFKARLELEGEARKTFLKRLNSALIEKGFPVFGEVDLDDQEGLGKKRREILSQGFYDSIQQKLRENSEITQLRNISISGAEHTSFQVQIDNMSLAGRIGEFGRTGVLGDIEPLEITPILQASVEDFFIELRLLKDRTQVYVDKGEIHTLGRIEQHILELPRDLDSVLDFLKRPALEIVQIVKSEGLVWEEYVKEEFGYDIRKGKYIDGDTSINGIERYGIFLNTTALTPISHIKNRVFYLLEETPEDFPMSKVVQDILGKIKMSEEDFENTNVI